MLMADFILSARRMNLDGRRRHCCENSRCKPWPQRCAKITKKHIRARGRVRSAPFFYCRTLTTVIENGPYLQHHEGPKPCCSVSIRFSAITVCTVGHRFGHGWPVVMTGARGVKSAFSEGLKNLRFYLPINAFSTSITKTHHT